jgi:hypothetical protein
LSLPSSRPLEVLTALRTRWQHGCYLYPDLVSFDADAAGEPQALALYVSVK